MDLFVEADVSGSFVQDCEVCCQPWTVRVRGDGDGREVTVRREDGSD